MYRQNKFDKIYQIQSKFSSISENQIVVQREPNLFHVDFKWTSWLTLRAGTRFQFLILSLKEWPQNETALDAVIFDHVQLWKYSRAASDNPSCANELVQVKLP